ncbi:golgin subfamily A member 6-like protein 7 [Leucoraja erinacea]|uniref:golgin subfamily A member 6-like protein 7 n=1 Tax=Leucoraja erinaceus TaxID=7782 RepID=UPI002455C037|nr:golgin subfamily A member 6-like protein 7 [Leucoraja erinacea]
MLQPKVESEAGRMSQKLWELHSQVNDLHLELKRKEAHLNTLQSEKESLSNKFKLFNDSHSREKQSLVKEIMQLKKMKELRDRELSHKEMELLQSKQELERQITALKNTEHKVITIKEQIGQRSEQEKIIVTQLGEERLNLLKVQSSLHEMEGKYRSNTAAMQDKISHDYRDEIRLLHQQLREKDMMRKQDCFLRSKMTDDCTTLVKENAQIHAQILELKKQKDRERMVKEETDICHTSSAVQLITIKDHKQQLEYEVRRHKERLEIEKNRFKEHMEKILLLEQGKTSLELNRATVLSRISEEQSRIANAEEENLQLQRDKGLLVDLVTDLQKQLSRQEEELSRIYSEIHLIDEDISTLKSQKALEHSVESERWKELSRMSSLATLTGLMSRSGRKFVC